MKTQKSIYNFLAILFIALSFAACSDNDSNREGEEQEIKGPKLRHVVLFKFKESATPENIETVEKAFAALPAKISAIKGFEWGTNNSPEGLSKGFTHCFLLTFNSEEDRKVYLPHPDHQNFGKEIGQYIQDVLVVDYWAPAE